MSLTLANRITIGRFLLIPVLVATVLSYVPERDYIRWIAWGIYLLAELTDVVDGYVARHFHQKTRAGSILDPLADKILFLATLVCLYKIGNQFSWAVMMPLWLVVAFFTRDALLLVGGLLLEIHGGLTEIRPNIWGKITAFLQAVCLSVVFLQWAVPSVVWWIALASVAISGILYMMEGIKVLNHGRHA